MLHYIWYSVNAKPADNYMDGVFRSSNPFDFIKELQTTSAHNQTFSDVELVQWKVIDKEQYERWLKNFAITF